MITVGNTLQSPGNTDILITKYNNNGVLLWEQTVDGQANAYDYGTAVVTDIQGDVYVAGATTNFNSLLDFTILKYNTQGVLQWTNNWSGSANLFDVPTSIKVDAFGNVVVTGISMTTSLETDMVVQKYSTNGYIEWTSFYDNIGLNELPVSVDFISGGEISVKGFTNTATGGWGLLDVRFSEQTGALNISNTAVLPQISIEDAFAITTDDLDNIYIAGSSNSSNNKNYEVIKVNSLFEVEWSNQFDGKGYNDEAKVISLDAENNIVVSGNSIKPTGGTDILTIKLNSTGQEIWRRSYMAPMETGEAVVSKMRISSDGEIFLAGTVDGEDGKDFSVFMYDKTGAIRLDQNYNSTVNNSLNNNDRVTDFQIFNNNEIFITGTTDIPGYGTKFSTVKYDMLRKNNGNVLINGKPHHRANEIIVKFYPQDVNLSFVDNRKVKYGDISDVLPLNMIEDINKHLSTPIERAEVIKIFHRLTTATTTSTTRLDEVIDMPNFWSVFLLSFPSGTDMETMNTELNNIPEHVIYAHFNTIFTFDAVPNDFEFTAGNQRSLFSSAVFPTGNINVEPAWDYETGQNHTKVGVYDSEIFWAHPDFGNGTLAGSQITGGWDFYDDVAIGSVTSPNLDHGTHVAGIIGALRNNTIGIAGIAGGGLDGAGTVNPGVQLFSLGIGDWKDCNEDGLLTPGLVDCNFDDLAIESERDIDLSSVAPAIVEGAAFNSTTGFGYGLHITNHSYSGSGSHTLRDAVLFSFQNQCNFVASRGNGGTNIIEYPSGYRDEWVLNVAASGTDGLIKTLTNGDLDPTGMSNWMSSFGGGTDVTAPGVSELVTTLANSGNVDLEGTMVNGVNICTIATTGFDCFNGTSASAPHVAGVAALMHSRHHTIMGQPNNLSPEDIELVLKKNASNFPNYSVIDGSGLIDAGEAVKEVSGPCYEVKHSGLPSTTVQTTGGGQQITLAYPIGNLPAGLYWAEKEILTETFLEVFPSDVQILDYWGRPSSTIGVSQANPVSGIPYSAFSFVELDNALAVTATTYAWHVLQSYTTDQNMDVWIPAPPAQLGSAYSVHLKFDSKCETPTSTDNIVELDEYVIANPNPTSGLISIKWKISKPSEPKILSLYSVDGRSMITHTITKMNEGFLNLDLSEYPSGVYFIKILTNNEQFVRKIIKQ